MSLLITRIVIERHLTDDGDEVTVVVEDAEGNVPPFIETLGLLRMADDTIIRQYMGDEPEEDE